MTSDPQAVQPVPKVEGVYLLGREALYSVKADLPQINYQVLRSKKGSEWFTC